MGWEMPESAIVLFTLIDGPAFFFFSCKCLHLLRVITHRAEGSNHPLPARAGDEGGTHGAAVARRIPKGRRAVSSVDDNDMKREFGQKRTRSRPE